MFKRSVHGILATLIFLTMTATSPSVTYSVQIAEAEVYEYQRQVKPGGDWWGIFPDGKGGYTLQPTRVSAVPDLASEDDPTKAPRKISVPGGKHGTFVFRGLMAAAAGPLKTVKLKEYPAPLVPGETFALRWDGDSPETRMCLRVAGRPVVTQDGKHTWRKTQDYELWLERGSGLGATRQLLFKNTEVYQDEEASLRWAGDLDRDGQLDLIYALGGHYTETRLALFLSSAAKPGELVGLVARWDGSCGC